VVVSRAPCRRTGGSSARGDSREVTAREHFTGFRSHSTLLAAVPAVILETLIVQFIGVPSVALLLFLPVIPVFALSFYLLRRAFLVARQTRLARPPAA